MADLEAVWKQVLPEIRNSVTGVGVWAALNTCRPITLDGDNLILGLPHGSTELSGHLKMAHIKTIIEKAMSQALGQMIAVRVIEGNTQEDWETAQRRDQEAMRLREQALQRAKAESSARSSWDTVYEQLNRRFAAVQNKSLPQNRAAFYKDAIEIIVHARKNQTQDDDLAERNFARCLERIAQYTEIPSAMVAVDVLARLNG